MYYYIFSSNNSFQQIIVDDTGVPIQKETVKYPETSIIKYHLEKSEKLLIFGEAMNPDQAGKILNSNKMKDHVYQYSDEKISDIFDNLETEQDWENFFEENDISSESAKSPVKYICH